MKGGNQVDVKLVEAGGDVDGSQFKCCPEKTIEDGNETEAFELNWVR